MNLAEKMKETTKKVKTNFVNALYQNTIAEIQNSAEMGHYYIVTNLNEDVYNKLLKDGFKIVILDARFWAVEISWK